MPVDECALSKLPRLFPKLKRSRASGKLQRPVLRTIAIRLQRRDDQFHN